MPAVLRDARLGLRSFGRAPGFTAVAVLTLALGIAATTAIYSVVHATFFEPLPYRDAERLVMVWSQHPGRTNVSPGDYVEWKREAGDVFEGLVAWTSTTLSLTSGGQPMQVDTGVAAPGFMPLLGFGHPLALGRDFLDEEGTPGREQVVILSHALWRERFGANPRIIGQPIRLDSQTVEVVGVLGAGAGDNIQHRMWVPLAIRDPQDHGARFLTVMGRLRPGVTVEQANARLAAIAARRAVATPSTNRGWTVSVEPFLNNFISAGTKHSLWLLLGAVGFVLLIACANVANLLLARGTVRRREITVRTALGAPRRAIVQQLLTESLLLAVIGGACGVALAAAAIRVIVVLMPPFMLPAETVVRLNVPVLVVTLAASVISGILFGIVPAWQATRGSLTDALRDGGRSVHGGRGGLRRALVVVEFALALTLLTGGGVALYSFTTLAATDLGFRSDHLLVFNLPVRNDRFPGPDAAASFYTSLIERIDAVPGVRSAAVVRVVPLRGSATRPFHVDGRPVDDPSQRPTARINVVGPRYHETMGMPVTRGRAFTAHDRAGTPPVVLVSETLAKQFFPHADPLTQRLVIDESRVGAPGRPIVRQIVGVIADVRSAGPKDDIRPEIHLPFAQEPWPRARVVVRAAGDPAALQPSLAAVVQQLDPDLPLGDVRTMDQIVAQYMVGDRFNTALFGSFAAVALLLAGLGIYGVMAFAVAQRRTEIGVRMALGASRSRVLGQVLREGLLTALTGVALGSLGAWWVVRAMRELVFGVTELAPAAFAVVTLTLLAAALVACLVPASRAASIDPMIALRQD
jgi:putative ABC transport system permease protein